MTVSRRRVLRLLVGSGAALLGAAGAGLVWLDRRVNPHTPLRYAFPPEPAAEARAGLVPTPVCDDDVAPTEAVTEGPFYKPESPERTTLRDAETYGQTLVIEGRVLTPDCKPVAGAVLDFWSCDGRGVYDNEGFRLRGHQFTDAGGRFRVETVRPAAYRQFGVRRTPHIHVKVQGRTTALLTTQLFFPAEPLNEKDMFFKSALVMKMADTRDGALAGSFDFVLTPA